MADEAPVVKPDVIFVLGGPGSGKGTQCAKMVEKYNYTHLSAGDLLRAERKSGSENAQKINDLISAGQLVPSDITVGLIKTAMEKAVAGAEDKVTFIIDGFPRNEANEVWWEKLIGDWAEIRFVLFFDTTEEVMLERLLERGKSSGRSDDKADVIKAR